MTVAADAVHSGGLVWAFVLFAAVAVGMPALAAGLVAVCDWLDRRARKEDPDA